MSSREQYPYLEVNDAHGQSLRRPLLPITLWRAERFVTRSGLLDTGATINVLPLEVGLELGLSWEAMSRSVELAGNLGRFEARGVVLTAQVGQYSPIPLVFAWTRAPNIPLILGQVNFFSEFDVCFFGARGVFEIGPKQGAVTKQHSAE